MADSRLDQVLVIEDEPELAALISLHLKAAQCEVHCANNGREGLSQALSKRWQLIVLDIRLPGLSGLDVCRELRASKNAVPILMLTALGSELDRVVGLELGADDYLTKPFSVMELQARAKALIRRVKLYESGQTGASTATIPVDEMVQAGPLKIDCRQHRVWLAGSEVSLTRREFDLLLHFASNPGQIFTRSDLLDAVWGASHSGFEHTVNSHINRLRSKLGDDKNKPSTIETVWGVGYRFVHSPTV